MGIEEIELAANSAEKIKVSNSNSEFKVEKDEFPRHEIEMPEPVKEISKAPLPDLETISNKTLEQLIDEEKEFNPIDQEIPPLRDLKENVETSEKDREGMCNNEDTENTSESEETDEDDELDEDEINAKQVEAIKEALEKIRNGEHLTTEELGNLGEMMMDQYFISQGYKPLNKHRVTGLDDKKEGFRTGIDGVYEKTRPDGTKQYVIVDAKFNHAQLSETNDGKQMSENWIDNRLDDAVGKEKADEIREAEENDPSSVKHYVYHIDPNVDESGRMHSDLQELDENANGVGEDRIVEYFDKDGNRIESKSAEDGE